MAKANTGAERRGKDSKRGRMPTKRSINLVKVDEKKPKIGIAIPAMILIVILAGVFSKFFVIDRFAEMDAAFAEVVRLRNQVDDLNDALEKYTDVEDVYAHYTKADMKAEELALVDRVLVIDLVKKVLPEGKGSKKWNVTGNVLTIEVAESTLGKQNELTKEIEKSPIVDSCTITRASKNKDKEKDEEVRAIMTVYLKQPEEDEEEDTNTSSEPAGKIVDTSDSSDSSDGSNVSDRLDSSGTSDASALSDISDASDASMELNGESFDSSEEENGKSSVEESNGEATDSSVISSEDSNEKLAESSAKSSAKATEQVEDSSKSFSKKLTSGFVKISTNVAATSSKDMFGSSVGVSAGEVGV